MIAFCLSFLAPLVAQALGASPVLACAGAGLALLAPGPPGERRLGLLFGLLLYGIVVVPGPAARRPGTAELVCLRAETGAVRFHPHGWTARLVGGLRLHGPTAVPAPLPGTEVEALGSYQPHRERLTIKGAEDLAVLRSPSPWRLDAHLERLRRAWRKRLEERLSPECSASLRALALGDALPAERREILASSGLLHLFAVSGLHLVLLLGLLRRGPFPGRPGLVLVLLAGYALLTGARAPVTRAWLLVAGDLGARVLRRPPRPLAHLLLAATVILALDPQALTSPGFQLSFGAYAGIRLLGLPLLRRELPRPAPSSRRRLAAAGAPFVVGASAWLGSLAPALWHFGRVSPAGIVLTPLLEPLVIVSMMLAAMLLLAPGCPPLAVSAEAADGVLGTVALQASLWVPTPAWPRPSAFGLALLLGALGLLALELRRDRRRGWLVVILLAMAAGGALHTRPPGPGYRLLDGGGGASVLLTTADGEHGLVDAGEASARVDRQLREQGVKRLAWIAITHDQADHAGGLPALRAAHPEAEVWESGHPPLVRGPGRIARRGPFWMKVLWPDRDHGPFEDTNDGSAVLLTSIAGRRALHFGDLEDEGFRALRRLGPLPPAALVVAPHHGSWNDALLAVLAETEAQELWLPTRPGFPDEGFRLLAALSGVRTRASFRVPGSEPVAPARPAGRAGTGRENRR